MSEVLDRLKQKYPVYQSVPEREVALQLGRKFPQYLTADSEFREEFDRFERGQRLRQERSILSEEEAPTVFGELKEIGKDVGSQIVVSAANVLASVPEAVALTAGALEKKLPTFGPERSEEMATMKLANAIRSGASKLAGEIDPETAESFMLGKFPQAFGSAAGFIAGGAAGRIAKVPAALGIASLGAASGGVEGFRRAKRAGADDQIAFQSFVANAAVGTSEAIPLAGMLNRLNKASGNALGRALMEGTEEALQETFQTLSGNKIAQTLTQEDVQLLSDALENGSAGALTGFAISLLISATGRRGGIATEEPIPTTSKVPVAEVQEDRPPIIIPGVIGGATQETLDLFPGSIPVETVEEAVSLPPPELAPEETKPAPPAPPPDALPPAAPPVQESLGLAPDVPAPPSPESPSDQSLGIVPPVMRSVQRFLDRYAPQPPGNPPAVALDTGTVAPDFQPYEVSQAMANRPNGIGRIRGLGWLFDPRALNNSPVERGVITRAFEVTVGRAVSSSLGQQLSGSIDSAFKFNGSLITNVEAEPGAPLHISDFFEQLQIDPSVYSLTPEQQQAADQALEILGQIRALQEKNGIAPDRAEEGSETELELGLTDEQPEKPYFPRIRMFTDAERAEFGTPQGRGATVGSRQFFQKGRLFESEVQGVEKGVVYEPSIEKRLVTLLERSYRAIADKRLAENPELGGETIPDREARYLNQFAQEIASGQISREKVLEIARTPRPDERRVFQPAFMNRIFPHEVGDVLNQVYGQSTSRFRQKVSSLNSALKSVGFGIDFAAPFLQGQHLLFWRPDLWFEATKNHFRAFLDPKVMARYLSNPDNLQAMRELAQLGVPLGTLQDFVAGLREDQILPRTLRRGGRGGEVLAKTLEGFARSFQTFNEMSMVELWKAWREVTPKNQWAAQAETLQTTLLRGRLEEIGITPSQALFERALFLAPSYLRGSINLVASINASGVSGTVARRALGAWALGGTLLFIGFAKALGLDDEEILERLRPWSSNFLTLPIKFEDGRVRNFGLGGAVRSLMRLAGEVSESILRGDGKLKSLGMDNPVLRWFRGKLAPVLGFVSDAWLGEDFLGNDITPLEALRARLLPLSTQQLFSRPGEPPATGGDVIPSVLGLQVWPESVSQTFSRERDALAKRLGYSTYESAPLRNQVRMTQELKARPEFAIKPEATKRQIERALEADVERRERLTAALPKELQERLSTLGLRVTSYEPSLNLGKGVILPLTNNQRERYERMIVAAYTDMLSKMPWERVELLEPSIRQDIITKVLAGAKERARGELIRQMVTPP